MKFLFDMQNPSTQHHGDVESSIKNNLRMLGGIMNGIAMYLATTVYGYFTFQSCFRQEWGNFQSILKDNRDWKIWHSVKISQRRPTFFESSYAHCGLGSEWQRTRFVLFYFIRTSRDHHFRPPTPPLKLVLDWFKKKNPFEKI